MICQRQGSQSALMAIPPQQYPASSAQGKGHGKQPRGGPAHQQHAGPGAISIPVSPLRYGDHPSRVSQVICAVQFRYIPACKPVPIGYVLPLVPRHMEPGWVPAGVFA